MNRPTFQLKIRATGEWRDVYPEHESALFAAIERRTGIDETMARAILNHDPITHPDMIVQAVRPK
jgi:hypothetical protein